MARHGVLLVKGSIDLGTISQYRRPAGAPADISPVGRIIITALVITIEYF